MNRLGLAASVVLCASALAWVLHGRARDVEAPSGQSPRVWPGDMAVVQAAPYAIPPQFVTRRIYIDAGHGAAGNVGNTSARCQLEQDYTLALAEELGAALAATAHFEVKLSRGASELVDYHTRVSDAEIFGADAFLSLHSDVRGDNDSGDACPRSRSAPGFAVLWSDAADDALDDRRLGLARAMARQLQRMGVLPYSGADYRGMYAADTTPGVFVDRHEPQERIFVLHKPTMPSIIIETHNAWDDREVARWDQKQTREAFMAAVVTALVDALHDR